MSTPADRKPLLCRLKLHHKWKVKHAPEGGTYRQCQRCGKDSVRGREVDGRFGGALG